MYDSNSNDLISIRSVRLSGRTGTSAQLNAALARLAVRGAWTRRVHIGSIGLDVGYAARCEMCETESDREWHEWRLGAVLNAIYLGSADVAWIM